MTTAERPVETGNADQDFLASVRALGTDRLFAYVPIDQLKVDATYQRALHRKRVRDIVKNYDERLVGVLVCSVRDDGIYVVDGQHRLEALRELGVETIQCELRVGLSVKEEANIFYQLDTKRTSLHSDDGFRALLVADDPTAHAAMRAIEASGLRASIGEGPLPGAVRAFKTLMTLTTQYGEAKVTAMLTVLHDAWKEDRNVAPAAVMTGLTYFMEKYPDASPKEVARTLREHSNPEQLIAQARQFTTSMSWSTATAMGRAILAVYNYRRSVNTLPDRMDVDLRGRGMPKAKA